MMEILNCRRKDLIPVHKFFLKKLPFAIKYLPIPSDTIDNRKNITCYKAAKDVPLNLQGGRKMLDSVNHNQVKSTLYAHQSQSMEATFVSNSQQGDNQVSITDSVSLKSESTTSLTYSGDLKLDGEIGSRFRMLQDLVANLLKEQGIDTKVMVGETEIDITDLSPEDAQELVADDGYFGVEQTSERIFQFAVGVAGGDPSRIDAIKEGVDNGFQEALDAFGGWLPEISYDTYDAVMEKLDNWVAESEAVA